MKINYCGILSYPYFAHWKYLTYISNLRIWIFPFFHTESIILTIPSIVINFNASKTHILSISREYLHSKKKIMCKTHMGNILNYDIMKTST